MTQLFRGLIHSCTKYLLAHYVPGIMRGTGDIIGRKKRQPPSSWNLRLIRGNTEELHKQMTTYIFSNCHTGEVQSAMESLGKGVLMD